MRVRSATDPSASAGSTPKMNTAMVDPQPTRPIAKLGLVGEGGVVHLPASCCSFLKDASEYIEDGLFAVPFSAAALRVVEAFCSTPIQVRSASATSTGPHYTSDLISLRVCRFASTGHPSRHGEANGLQV